MTTTYFDNYGTFTRTPDFLDNYEIPQSAKRIFTLLANLADVNGRVYICRSKIKEKVDLAKTTISTLITTLEKEGLLKRTGEFAHAIYPIVTLTPKKDEGISKIKSPSFEILTTPLAKSNPQLEQELDLNLKEQTAKNVCDKNSPKEKTLRQKLTSQGMHKNQAKRLIARHSAEKIEEKLEQLAHHKARGDTIKNPAGWLTSAITKDFALSATLKKDLDEAKTCQTNRLIDQAEWAVRENNLDKARELAQKSFEVNKTNHTKGLLQKIEQEQTYEKNLACAKATIPKDQQDRLFAECLAQQPTKIKSLQLDEVGIRLLAKAEWHRRLIKLVTA